MLSTLNLTSLREWRAQTKQLMMYRIVYRMVDNPTTCLIPTINIRRNQHYMVPFARTVYYQTSFFFSDSIRLWNSLPKVQGFDRRLYRF